MEISSFRGFSELGMEDSSLFSHWHMNNLDELSSILPLAAAFGDNLHHSFNHPSLNLTNSAESYHLGYDRPAKQQKTNSWNSGNGDNINIPPPQAAFSSNSSISFVNTNSVTMMKPKEEAARSPDSYPSNVLNSQNSSGDKNYAFKANQAKRSHTGARLSHAQDHIIAERKRREKLSQRFIALSALVPGLKKMDKASVLGDTIKYVKQSQEKIKILEEQNRKKTMESVVFVKKSELFSEAVFDEPLPEIEARLCEKNVLIRLHCEKQDGILEKILAQIAKFHLTIINSSVLTFGSSALDITIIAQMDAEFCMTGKDLVKNIRSIFE